MRIIVQKFGGTSVATREAMFQAARRVSEARQRGLSTVVVVSAMGRKPEPYATDTLISLLEAVGGEISLREKDSLMACGEIISSVIMTQVLRSIGIPAISFTGAQAGITTDENFGEARILRINPQKILEHLEAGETVVVAGFQGVTTTGEVTTLGRGGSDTTAAALGVALGAELVEIYTDVDGIMAADPRLVPDAKPKRAISYRELAELANLGAKVVHPRAVEIAMKENIPLMIKSTFSDAPGTLVCSRAGEAFEAGPVAITGDKLVVGVAHMIDMTQVCLESESDVNETGLALSVFANLAAKGVSVDLINVSPHEIAFIVNARDAEAAKHVLEEMRVSFAMRPGCAKVSVVGAAIRGVPGVMARVVEALSGAGVKILQTSDSHTSISCLIDQSQLAEAVRALYDKFDLSE